MLDGWILSSETGLPFTYPNEKPMAVIKIQASTVKGGNLLTICAQHNVMDTNADAQFRGQFARLCNGRNLVEEDVRYGNADRNTLIPDVELEQAVDPLDTIRCPSGLSSVSPPWPPRSYEVGWTCFRFNGSSLRSSKEEAMKPPGPGSIKVKYISTNDALSAFI